MNYSEYFASINGDLEVYTPGTEKNKKNKTSFYPFLSTLHMASPTLSQALSSPLSSLASTHTTHQIVLIRCVQCVELKESIRMHCGWSIGVYESARATPLKVSRHPANVHDVLPQ